MIAEKTPPGVIGFIEGEKNIFLVGCGGCVTTAGIGGEKQVIELKQILEGQGQVVTGYIIPERMCWRAFSEPLLRENIEAIKASDCIAVLACGGGQQVIKSTSEELGLSKVVHLILTGQKGPAVATKTGERPS